MRKKERKKRGKKKSAPPLRISGFATAGGAWWRWVRSCCWRALRAEAAGDSGDGAACKEVCVVGDSKTLHSISSLPASLPWPRKTSR